MGCTCSPPVCQSLVLPPVVPHCCLTPLNHPASEPTSADMRITSNGCHTFQLPPWPPLSKPMFSGSAFCILQDALQCLLQPLKGAGSVRQPWALKSVLIKVLKPEKPQSRSPDRRRVLKHAVLSTCLKYAALYRHVPAVVLAKQLDERLSVTVV